MFNHTFFRVNTTIILFNKVQLLGNRDDSTRYIFYDKDYVIKLECDEECGRGYWQQCSREIKRWKSIDDADKQYFATLHCYEKTNKYDYIIQTRYRFKKRTSMGLLNYLYDTIVEPIAYKYKLNDVDLFTNWDVTTNGNPVIYDYSL